MTTPPRMAAAFGPRPVLVVGVTGAATAGVMAAVGGHNHGVLTGLVLIAQCCFAVAWVYLLDTPSPLGAIAISVGAAAASDGVLLAAHHVALGDFAVIVALAFLLSLVWQIGRLDRTRVTESLAAVLSASVLAVAGGAYLTLSAGLNGEQSLSSGRHAVTAALLGVATVLGVGRLVDAVLPLPALPGTRRRGAAGLLLGLAAAAGVGAWYGSQVSPLHDNPSVVVVSSLTTGKALWVALVAAAVAAVVDLGIDAGLGALPADPPPVALPGPRPRAPWPARLGVAALLPVLVAAPPAYVIARVVLT